MIQSRIFITKFVCGITIFAANSGSSTTRAQFVSGSDGSDGSLDCIWLASHDVGPDAPRDADFNCAQECYFGGPPCIFIIDLGQAQNGHWRDTPGSGSGVYDAEQWAVVFKHTSIDVPSFVIVKFENHPSGAPVAWLATGNVNILGEVNLNGGNGPAFNSPGPSQSIPGPGGFAGGISGFAGAAGNALGYGPGGTTQPSYGAQHGSYTYGNVANFPLIGGSGGSAFNNSEGGGAGGGAILIASSTEVNVSGKISANGGSGYYKGSGGAIRLVANLITGAGTCTATSPSQSYTGRIRIEAPDFSLPPANTTPTASFHLVPGRVFPLPEDSAPTLRLVKIDTGAGNFVIPPSDPDANLLTTDVAINAAGLSTLHIEATNVDVAVGNNPTKVEVKIIPARGAAVVRCPNLLARNDGSGILDATTTLTFPPGRAEIQMRATWDAAGLIACTERN